MGQKLAAALNRLIDERASDDKPRVDIVEGMASAASIELNTVYQILQGEITCPPLERLRGFASVLGTSVDSLRKVAEGDGCDYSDRSDSEPEEDPEAEETTREVPIKEVIPRAQYEALVAIKKELERAIDS